MGYYSKVTGALDVSPQLVGDQINNVRALDPDYLGYFLHWQVRQLIVPTEVAVAGEKVVVQAQIPVAGVLVAEGTSGKTYELEKQVRALVAEFYEDGRVVNGLLRIEGEEAGDIWRIKIEANQVTVQEAILMWPDGEQEKRR